MILYLMVTTDELRLPLIVTDSVLEMSRKTGKTVNNIQSQISKDKRGILKRSPFIRVEVDDEEI